MLKYMLRRLGVALLVAITVSLVTFSLIHLTGDPAMALAGESATEQDIRNIRRVYGFDKPFIVQYVNWLGSALTGDLGHSHYLKTDVANVIFERLPTTMTLGGCALAFALMLSIPLGVLAAIRPNTLVDRMALSLAVVGQALPSFWFALILIYWLGIEWRLLPITGTASWLNFIMPAVALGYYVTPAVMRLTRAGMLDVLASDYIRTARAKGVPEHRVVLKHALKNAFLPVLSYLGPATAMAMTGSFVVEKIFAVPGIGTHFVNAVLSKDLTLIMGVVLAYSTILIVLNLVVDILYRWVDPRIEIGE